MTNKQAYDQKFMEKVLKGDNPNDCWIWIGPKRPAGYGRFSVNGNICQAHRYSYSMKFGEIPDNLNILHRCDNKSCVNPDHLFPGTQKDNMEDMSKKGRGRSRMTSTEQDNEIIKCYISENFKLSALAARFGVGRSTVMRIIVRARKSGMISSDQKRKTGSKPIDVNKRFFSHVIIPKNPESCWEWTGCIDGSGGRFMISRELKTKSSHRFSYEIHIGNIPKGMEVIRKCGNIRCVNPKHFDLK